MHRKQHERERLLQHQHQHQHEDVGMDPQTPPSMRIHRSTSTSSSISGSALAPLQQAGHQVQVQSGVGGDSDLSPKSTKINAEAEADGMATPNQAQPI